ncbi:hypothetical protein [Streptomyces tuirus]
MAGTAVLVAVTLPGTAGADDSGVRADRSARQRAGAAGAGGRAVSPGRVAGRRGGGPDEERKGEGRDPLTDDEPERVGKIALGKQLLRGSDSVDGGRGPQRLGVDLADPRPTRPAGRTRPGAPAKEPAGDSKACRRRSPCPSTGRASPSPRATSAL